MKCNKKLRISLARRNSDMSAVAPNERRWKERRRGEPVPTRERSYNMLQIQLIDWRIVMTSLPSIYEHKKNGPGQSPSHRIFVICNLLFAML